VLACTLTAVPAHAGDTWSTIRTGVDYLHRTGSGQDIYAVRVDLTVPNVGIHASNETSGDERYVTTPTFARNADVLVAINGDWSGSGWPVGLAISDGWLWNTHIVDDTVGGRWGFFACTATKQCTVGAELPLDQAWWFASPTIRPYRYFQAVGANGEILVSDGVAESGCYDTARNPRSAICLDATGTTLWLVAVDGRSSSAAGMTCDETRDLMLDLGCWDAAMLDGGGSTTLVIENDVKNNPSDGSPRTVSNHLGIVYTDPIESACVTPNGRWCEGTVIGTCQGGRYLGSGDCAAYGATCQEDGDYAFCVDYRCPGGDGNGAVCTGASTFQQCVDGVYSEGDCGVFGLACGTDAGGTSCMDTRCEAGPNSAFCTDAGLYAACSAGTYAEGDCAAYGLVCWEGGGTATCVDGRCPDGPEGSACSDAGIFQDCTAGAYAESDCVAAGLVCDPAAGCVDPGADTDTDTDPGARDTAPSSDPSGEGPGGRTRLDGLPGCECGSEGGAAILLLGPALIARRRRRHG
jgi:hypothetical protein